VIDKAAPRAAATVVLLRPAEPDSFEILLTRRPDRMLFLGGMYCFPGGTVRPSDCADAILERCRGVTPERARKVIGAHAAPRQALGFWVAALRELFEEVGVLLAIDAGGAPAGVAGLAEKHRALTGGALRFDDVLQRGNLYGDLGCLCYFSHWQTPSENPTRFDTRFFVTTLPRNQSPLENSSEVAEIVWLTADEALRRQAAGELPMIFPTFASLRTLANFETIESVMREFA
jgi:8-oxo-dGTP pyrophosphatase MutT (NUDIX family)